jgi:CubicO group peptidase (beta-lactamase class C family)
MKKAVFFLLLIGIHMIGISQTIEQSLKEVIKRNEIVGLSVCLVKEGRIVYTFNEGLKDVGRNLKVDNKTVFRIASVSKMFTVTALMQLYDQGKFKLNDDVSRYLGFELRNPNFPEQPITFAMLMSHTSGLRDGEGYDNFLMASYRQVPFPDISSVLIRVGSFFTEDMWSSNQSPESRFFTYANINFGILGTLVERISGERFDKYCINNIFQPLGIEASFDVRDIPDINNIGAIYRKEAGKWVAQNDEWKGVRPSTRNLNDYVIGSNAVIFAPQGGLRASAADLAKFLILHQNNGIVNGVRLLSDSTANRMRQVIWKYTGSNGNSEKEFFTNYALGCMRTEKLIPGVELVGHSGDAYGLLSGLYYSENQKLGIVFITNGGVWKPGSYSGWQSVEEEIVTAGYNYLNGIK